MNTYTAEQLAEIIEKHRKWLENEEGGKRANLIDANLSGAYLSDANLSDANLIDANLSGANLIDANLSDANLSGAYLSDANLSDANLSDANLSDAKLSGASGNCAEIKAIQCDLWPVTYTATHMQIGCQLHSLSEWWAFSDEEISLMESRALAWWRIWKPILQQIVEVSPAVPGAAEEQHDAESAEVTKC